MSIRVFLLLALIFYACESTTQSTNVVQNEPEKKATGEIIDVVEYHPNGVVKLRGKSQDGKRVGKWESFYPNGYRWSEATYRNGYREGDAVTYYSNGMMRYHGRYYNDEQTGIWMFYNEKGVLIEKIDMDEPQGNYTDKTDSNGLR